MDNQSNAYMMLPGISAEEIGFLQQATAKLDENQQRNFYNVYAGKRKSPQDILLLALLGLLGVSGIHRIVLGQVGMGIVYLLTGGLCLIGTIMDLINHKTLTLDFNKKMAYESFQIVSMGGGGFTF